MNPATFGKVVAHIQGAPRGSRLPMPPSLVALAIWFHGPLASVLVLTRVLLQCPLTTCVSCRQQLGSHRAWHCEGPFAQPCCRAEWPGSTAGRQRLHWLAASRVPGMGAAPPGGCKGTRAKSDQLKVSSATQRAMHGPVDPRISLLSRKGCSHPEFVTTYYHRIKCVQSKYCEPVKGKQ